MNRHKEKRTKTMEEISDENMIHFYKTELEMIRGGEKAGDLLPDGMVKKFREMGLFKRKVGYVLNDKRLSVLQEFPE